MADKYSEIKKKIRKCYSQNNNISPEKRQQIGDFSMIIAYAIDFFSCVASGTIMGYLFDKMFETDYIFIISLFLLGVVAGICNVLKKYKHL